MKRVILLIVVLIGTMGINAQEYCSFNANNSLELDVEYGTALAAGTVIGETASIIATTGNDDVCKPQSVKATVGGIEISGGLQGSTNPKDADGGVPSTTLVQPSIGSFIIFQAKADGYLYVVHKAVSHKAYTVFEDGKAVSYTFASTGSETTDLGAVYQFTLPYTVMNGQNTVVNSVDWAEREFLKATAPEKFAAHWSEDESGNQTWNRIGIVGAGVIKFPVRKGSKYIVNSNGTKITAGGFYFDTAGDAEIKVDGVCILESDQKLPPPLPIDFDPSKRTIHVETAGTLPTLISVDDKYLIEELTLSGELNGTDIHFIRDMAGVNMDRMKYGDNEFMPGENAKTNGQLRVLDLSDAIIVEGGRDYYRMLTSDVHSTFDYYQYTKTNEISDCMFDSCWKLEELTLPRSVTSISSLIFAGNDGSASPIRVNIKSLKVADGNPNYESPGDCKAIIEKETKTLILGCSNSKIPECVTSIGMIAFYGYGDLTSITIPSSVTSIGSYSFYGCSSLTTVIVNIQDPLAIESGTFSNRANATLYVPKGSKAAYETADVWKEFNSIKECQLKRTIHVETAGTLDNLISTDERYVIEELTLTGEINGYDLAVIREMAGKRKMIYTPDKINSLDDFADTDGRLSVLDLSGVKIVSGGSYLELEEQYGGYSLISLAQDDVIPTGVFYGCKKLTSISVPSGLKNVGTDAFEGTPWYENQPEGLVYIGNVLYKYKGDMPENYHITIKAGTIGIANSAFSGRSTLSSIVIPESVKYIGIDDIIHMDGCLLFSDFLEGLTYSNVFGGCTSMTTINIPNDVTYIGKCAFGNCSCLTSVTIPNSITSICDYVFSGCSGLTSITIPNSVTSIGMGAFNGTAWFNNQPDGLVYAGKVAYSYKGEMPANTSITIKEGTIGIANRAFSGCSGLTSITIPNSVTSIGDFAFRNCSSLTSITIPNSVTSIGEEVFSYSGLTSVTIPNSVITIGDFAFSVCRSLMSVTVDIQEPLAITFSTFVFGNQANATLYVPKGSKAAYEATNVWKDFKEIKEFARDEEVTCALEEDNTATVTAANDPTEKDVVIPESVMIGEESHPVTAIGENAFKNNTELALACIPETIDEIGDNAFAGCSNLKTIYCYNDEPIALGSDKATVRTRADGNETSATAVFADVDKTTCILYVPLNSANKYRTAEGWGEFENIVEMKSNILGDANNDGEVDDKDLEATSAYIMEGKTDSFIFKNADVKTDSRINAADIVKIVNLKK